MGDLIHIEDIAGLSGPGVALINCVSNALGDAFKPFQIRRVAKAEADAELIKAQTQIEIDEIQRRACERFIAVETRNQKNMESIIQDAIPLLEEKSRPQDIEEDWIANFFDKCKLVSDEDMQKLWGKVLAGEANSPGKYSKRTANILQSLDKKDAELFTRLCCYIWDLDRLYPLIMNIDDSIYSRNSMSFDTLTHLDGIGLITFGDFVDYRVDEQKPFWRVSYFKKTVIIRSRKNEKFYFDIGKVLLSKTGIELAQICEAKPNWEYFNYMLKKWAKTGFAISSPYPRD